MNTDTIARVNFSSPNSYDKRIFRLKSIDKRDNFFDTISKNIGENVCKNILGKLRSYSMKTENKIEFKEAFKYLLSLKTLSLCHADGTKEVARRPRFIT